MVTALSALILREQVGIRRWLAILMGFVGVVVILRPGAAFDWFLLLPLATGFCYAGYQFSTRVLSFSEPTLTLFFYTAVTGAVVTSAMLPFYWVTPDLEGAAIFLMTGLFGFLGQFLMIRSLQVGEASTVTPFMYAQLIWADDLRPVSCSATSPTSGPSRAPPSSSAAAFIFGTGNGCVRGAPASTWRQTPNRTLPNPAPPRHDPPRRVLPNRPSRARADCAPIMAGSSSYYLPSS